MSITPLDILGVAQTLQQSDGEACQRSSISRAYYAVYHGCLTWEKTLPMLGSGGTGHAGGSHQQLINRLRNPAPEVKNDAAKKLSKVLATRVELLRTRRHAVDYDLTSSDFVLHAANDCATAAHILTQISPSGGSTNPPAPPPAPPVTPPLVTSTEKRQPANPTSLQLGLKRVK